MSDIDHKALALRALSVAQRFKDSTSAHAEDYFTAGFDSPIARKAHERMAHFRQLLIAAATVAAAHASLAVLDELAENRRQQS